MKKFKYFILFLVFIGVTAPILTWAAPKKRVIIQEEVSKTTIKKQKKTGCGSGSKPLRVAGFVTNPPFGWIEEVGNTNKRYENNGFAFNLLKEIAEENDIQIENRGYTSYYDALQDLKKGEIDILAGMYFDRQTLSVAVTLITPSFTSNPLVVVFRKGEVKDIKSWADLKGMKGAVRQEEMIYNLIHNNIPKETEIQRISGAKNVYKKLLTKEIDFIISGYYSHEAQTRQFKLMDKVDIATQSLSKPELFFGFSANSKCLELKQVISEKLQEKIKTGAVQNQLIQYLDLWSTLFSDNYSFLKEIGLYEEKPDVSDDKIEPMNVILPPSTPTKIFITLPPQQENGGENKRYKIIYTPKKDQAG